MMPMEAWESMTPCERNGISGNCGMECRALHDGDCENEEMLEEWETLTEEGMEVEE